MSGADDFARPLEFPKLVLFGDSIFQYSSAQPYGLAPAIQDKFQRKLDVVTRGFSGYTTRWAAKMIDPVLASVGSGPIHAIVIFFGTNDAALEGNIQHVPLDEYTRNLEYIARKCQQLTSTVAIVGPSVVDETFGSEETDIRRNKLNRLYSNAARQVADKVGARFVDLWAAFRLSLGESPDADSFLGEKDAPKATPQQLAALRGLVYDGIHYTGHAYQIFEDALISSLDLHPETLSLVGKYWRDISDTEPFQG